MNAEMAGPHRNPAADQDIDGILDRAPDVVDDVRLLLTEAWEFGYTTGVADSVKIDEAAISGRVHKAVGTGGPLPHCTVCGQRIKRVPGGQGPTWVHADTGAVAAPNPPSQRGT